MFQAAWALAHPTHWHADAVVVALATVGVIVVGRRLHPLFPGVLVVAVLACTASAVGAYEGPSIDHIPSGLPPVTADDLPWSDLVSLVVPGLVIALVGFTEAASISRRFATEDRTRWSADREFVSQGAANITAALTGGFPCGGSFSRSAVARLSGATTRAAGAVAGIAVLAFLPFAFLLEPMPLACLAGIVISAVFSLLKFRAMWALWRISLPQALIAWGTFTATLLLAPRIDIAVLLGVGASLAVFLWRALRLDVDVEVRDRRLTLTPRGVLWFGTAQRLSATMLDVLPVHPDVSAVDIDASRLGRIDTTGALVLAGMLAQAREAGLDARVINVPPQSQELTTRILRSADLMT